MDLRFDDRMPQWLHVAICNTLQRMRPEQCRGSMQWTAEIVRQHHMDVPAAVAWLEEHHAHCDCEVIFNTLPTLDEIRH